MTLYLGKLVDGTKYPLFPFTFGSCGFETVSLVNEDLFLSYDLMVGNDLNFLYSVDKSVF